MRAALRNEYHGAGSKKEDVFNNAVRIYLFDNGIDYPLTGSKSPSGETDVLSLNDPAQPLVLEIKIYDSAAGYRKERIIKGFTQIVRYAHDFHQPVGYLIVFVLDAVRIEIVDTATHATNRVDFEGRTYFIIFIYLADEINASSAPKTDVIKITTNELFQELKKDEK